MSGCFYSPGLPSGVIDESIGGCSFRSVAMLGFLVFALLFDTKGLRVVRLTTLCVREPLLLRLELLLLVETDVATFGRNSVAEEETDDGSGSISDQPSSLVTSKCAFLDLLFFIGCKINYTKIKQSNPTQLSEDLSRCY